MKRCALIALLMALPLSAFADTSRYIVVTRHFVASAGRPLPDGDFEARPRQGIRTFQSINGFAADLDDNDLAILKRSPEVDYIEPVLERPRDEAPDHRDAAGLLLRRVLRECRGLLRGRADQGRACVAVTHDVNLALTFCTRIIVLADHTIACDMSVDAAVDRDDHPR